MFKYAIYLMIGLGVTVALLEDKGIDYKNATIKEEIMLFTTILLWPIPVAYATTNKYLKR